MTAVAVTACSKNDIIEINREEISFGKAFVDNATKAEDPSYGTTEKPLEKFNVYGTVTGNAGSAVLYTGDEVTGSVGEDVWSCDTKHYWIEDASYIFAALVDATGVTLENGLPKSFTYDASTQKDVLYATATATGKAPNNNTPVNFTFSHLLSKALFTFTNVDASATLTVSNIQIAGLNKEGTYIVGATTPWATSTEYTQDFGESEITAGQFNTCEYERMILPGTYNLTITFSISDDKGGKQQDITATIENQTFESGHVYNFTAEIRSGVQYIVFTIVPTDWAEGSDNTIQG